MTTSRWPSSESPTDVPALSPLAGKSSSDESCAGEGARRSDSPDDQIVLYPGVISTPACSRWTPGGCRDAADLANPRSRGSRRGPACMLLHVPQHAEDVLAQDSLHFPVVEAGVEERARHLR
jgi:hypothetical protein